MLHDHGREDDHLLAHYRIVNPKAASAEPRFIARHQVRWFLAGLLPAVIWGFTVWLSLPARFALLSPVNPFTVPWVGAALWWMSLCAWRLHRISRGYNLRNEIQHGWQWLGLLVMVNLPLAAILWFLAHILR